MKYFYIQVPINSPSLQMIQKCIKTNFSSTYTFYNILLGLSAVYLYVQIIPLFIYVNKDSMSNSFDWFDIHHIFFTPCIAYDIWDHCGCDRKAVGFTAIYEIGAYHH